MKTLCSIEKSETATRTNGKATADRILPPIAWITIGVVLGFIIDELIFTFFKAKIC